MAVGSELAQLSGYPFEVRYRDGSLVRARAAADIAANAYLYLSHLFAGVQPDIAVIVAGEKATAASLAPLLTEVSPTLGRAVRDWR